MKNPILLPLLAAIALFAGACATTDGHSHDCCGEGGACCKEQAACCGEGGSCCKADDAGA